MNEDITVDGIPENEIPVYENGAYVADWSNNLYAAAFDHVASLVTEDGFINPTYPFVPGEIDTESAFEVLQGKIEESFSEDADESIQNITSVVFLAFMMGAWVAAAKNSPSGYNINLTHEQISQVVQTWVSSTLDNGSN